MRQFVRKLVVTDPFNSLNAQTCNYAHDDLVRIASANCGSVWSQTFSYDAFGNIDKSGSSSFGPTYSYLTNRMTQIGSSYPTYDSNGNVTNDFLHSYTWDANGRPVTIDGVGITYDALGRMVEQNNGSYTEIAYSPTGYKMAFMNGQSMQKALVPLPGGAMAIYSGSTLYYRHPDWLGSSRFASTSSRTVYYDGAYAPFGEPYAQIGANDLSYTGMNQDTVANLYDFPAREYGIQGRWPSPDPAGISSMHVRDPQTLNRYAYVRNNPLIATDPTGLDCGEIAAPGAGDGCTDFDGGWNLDQEYGELFNSGTLGVSPDADCSNDPSECYPPAQTSSQPSSPSSGGSSAGSSGDSSAGDTGGCVYVLSDPCGTGSPPADLSIVVTGVTPLTEGGQLSIGAYFTYQIVDQDGQPVTSLGGWNVSEYMIGDFYMNGQLTTQDSGTFGSHPSVLGANGLMNDTVSLYYYGSGSGPISAGRSQTLEIYSPGWPTGDFLTFGSTGQSYTITVGWFLEATGPNKGTILGSNGASFSQ
jgi:RHS repeat-associated protein